MAQLIPSALSLCATDAPQDPCTLSQELGVQWGWSCMGKLTMVDHSGSSAGGDDSNEHREGEDLYG